MLPHVKSKLRPSFAKSLKEDWAAVKNGVTLSWSNGQVEGQINRLKTLKRQIDLSGNKKLPKRIEVMIQFQHP